MPFTASVGIISRDVEKTPMAWRRRLVNKPHSGLIRSSTRLTAITGHAGTNYILPGMLSTSVARDDMV